MHATETATRHTNLCLDKKIATNNNHNIQFSFSSRPQPPSSSISPLHTSLHSIYPTQIMKFIIALFISYASSTAANHVPPPPPTTPPPTVSQKPSTLPSESPSSMPSDWPSESPSSMPSETPSSMVRLCLWIFECTMHVNVVSNSLSLFLRCPSLVQTALLDALRDPQLHPIPRPHSLPIRQSLLPRSNQQRLRDGMSQRRRRTRLDAS